MNLTDRQWDILVMVAAYIEEHGYPPSMRDICEFCGVFSTSVAAYNLNILENKGLIYRERHISRAIAVTPTGKALLAEARA